MRLRDFHDDDFEFEPQASTQESIAEEVMDPIGLDPSDEPSFELEPSSEDPAVDSELDVSPVASTAGQFQDIFSSHPGETDPLHLGHPVHEIEDGIVGYASLTPKGKVRITSGENSHEISFHTFQNRFRKPDGTPFQRPNEIIDGWQAPSAASDLSPQSRDSYSEDPLEQAPQGSTQNTGTGSAFASIVATIIDRIRTKTAAGTPQKTRFDLDPMLLQNQATYRHQKAYAHHEDLKLHIHKADSLLDSVCEDYQVRFLSKSLARAEAEGAPIGPILSEYKETFFARDATPQAKLTGQNIIELFRTIDEIRDKASDTFRWCELAGSDVANLRDLYESFMLKFDQRQEAKLLTLPEKEETLRQRVEQLREWIDGIIQNILARFGFHHAEQDLNGAPAPS